MTDTAIVVSCVVVAIAVGSLRHPVCFYVIYYPFIQREWTATDMLCRDVVVIAVVLPCHIVCVIVIIIAL